MESGTVSALSVLRIVLVMVLALALQATVVMDISIAGVHPNLMLVFPIAAGVAFGPEEGAVVGFAAGMAADIIVATPFGLSALVWSLIGFGVGQSTGSVVRETWWLPAVVALAASAAAVMLYAVIGAVLGQGQFLQVDLVAVVLLVAGFNALLAAPAVRVMEWALRDHRQDHTFTVLTGGRR